MKRKSQAVLMVWVVAIFISCVSLAYASQLADEAIARGKDAYQNGLYDIAIKEFSGAIDSDSGSFQAYYNRGRVYQASQEYNKAIADYTKAIEINPNDAEVYYNRGAAYYYKDFIDDAIADWSKAIEVCPNCPESYHKRAFAYMKKKDYGKSWEDVHKLEEIGFTPQLKFMQELRRASGREQ